jgi:hypothetical protein
MPPVRRNLPAIGPAPHPASPPHSQSAAPAPPSDTPHNTRGQSAARDRSRQHQLLIEAKKERSAAAELTAQLKIIAHWQAHAHEHDSEVLLYPDRSDYARTAEQLIDWVSAPKPRQLVLSNLYVSHLPEKLLQYVDDLKLSNMPRLQSLEIPARKESLSWLKPPQRTLTISFCIGLQSVRLQHMENAAVEIENCRAMVYFAVPKSLAKDINLSCCVSEVPKIIDYSHLESSHVDMLEGAEMGGGCTFIPPPHICSYMTPSSYHFDRQGHVMALALCNRFQAIRSGKITSHPSWQEHRITHADVLLLGKSMYAIAALQSSGEFNDLAQQSARERVAAWRHFFGDKLRHALGQEFVEAPIGRRSYLKPSNKPRLRSKLEEIETDANYGENLVAFLVQWPVLHNMTHKIKSAMQEVLAQHLAHNLADPGEAFDVALSTTSIIRDWVKKHESAPTGPGPVTFAPGTWSLDAPPSETAQQTWECQSDETESDGA